MLTGLYREVAALQRYLDRCSAVLTNDLQTSKAISRKRLALNLNYGWDTCTGFTKLQNLLLQQTEVFEWYEVVQFCNLVDIVCACNTAIECELVRREQNVSK